MTAIMPRTQHDNRLPSVSAEFDAPIHPAMLDIWLKTHFVIHGVQHIVNPPIRLARWRAPTRKAELS